MRFLHTLAELALLELVASHAIDHSKDVSNAIAIREQAAVAAPAAQAAVAAKDWHPKTKQPHFFNLRVNDRCDPYNQPEPETRKSQCPFDSYAIRLEKGILVATPYSKWWDPKLATFFVDDDTQLYTVSKEPLQLYVDSVSGAVKYTKVGWLPPSAISTGWYHTGNNPLQRVDPSPSYLTWPSTYGITEGGEFAFCALGRTGQYQVFVKQSNFDSQGVAKRRCRYYQLAALNANPWKKEEGKPYKGDGHGHGNGYDTDSDSDDEYDHGYDKGYETGDDDYDDSYGTGEEDYDEDYQA